jgi:Glycoside hydrolase 123, catalytic domain
MHLCALRGDNNTVRGIAVLGALTAAVMLVAGSAGAKTRAAKGVTVGVYPPATSIRATGAVPGSPASLVSLDAAIGEQEDSVVVVGGAQQVQILDPQIDSPLRLDLFFAHYVSFDGTLVPDALLPWDGSARPTEQPNQPLWLRVTVPPGTPAGNYTGRITVAADGVSKQVPIIVKVFPVTLPAPNQVDGSLLTSFHVAAQSYGNMVSKLNGYTLSSQMQGTAPTLYSFLASYRISPSSWGYGSPGERSGYATNKRWWQDSASNMVAEVGDRAFAAMSIPVSNNRTAPANYIAGLSPNAPQTWCSYLQSVHSFWQQHGWLDSYPYLYGMDEPGLAGFKVVAQQAKAVHACFPGGHVIVTGNPSLDNRFLWNGGSDDVDVWVVLASRYYGKYTVPALTKTGVSHATANEKLIDAVRARGKAIWAYTYPGTRTPGFTATEPLSDSQLFFLWASLENIRGVLYGDGTTTYQNGVNPYQSVSKDGAFVLLYPGKDGPVPSARLEQVRDGIENWEILNIVRQKHGSATVRKILGETGLFSATATGVQLGCTVGCTFKTATPFSWPSYSHDATTPAKLEQLKLQALVDAS